MTRGEGGYRGGDAPEVRGGLADIAGSYFEQRSEKDERAAEVAGGDAAGGDEAAGEDSAVVASRAGEPRRVLPRGAGAADPTAGLTPQQRRLFELRLKLNESRKANQKAVIEEKKRKEAPEDYEKMQRKKREESVAKRRDELAEARLGSIPRTNTCSSPRRTRRSRTGAGRRRRRRPGARSSPSTTCTTRTRNAPATFGSTRRSTRWPRRTIRRSTRGRRTSSTAARARTSPRRTSIGWWRAGGAKEETRQFQQARKHYDERDVTHINDRNEHFNKKIERAFGQHDQGNQGEPRTRHSAAGTLKRCVSRAFRARYPLESFRGTGVRSRRRDRYPSRRAPRRARELVSVARRSPPSRTIPSPRVGSHARPSEMSPSRRRSFVLSFASWVVSPEPPLAEPLRRSDGGEVITPGTCFRALTFDVHGRRTMAQTERDARPAHSTPRARRSRGVYRRPTCHREPRRRLKAKRETKSLESIPLTRLSLLVLPARHAQVRDGSRGADAGERGDGRPGVFERRGRPGDRDDERTDGRIRPRRSPPRRCFANRLFSNDIALRRRRTVHAPIVARSERPPRRSFELRPDASEYPFLLLLPRARHVSAGRIAGARRRRNLRRRPRRPPRSTAAAAALRAPPLFVPPPLPRAPPPPREAPLLELLPQLLRNPLLVVLPHEFRGDQRGCEQGEVDVARVILRLDVSRSRAGRETALGLVQLADGLHARAGVVRGDGGELVGRASQASPASSRSGISARSPTSRSISSWRFRGTARSPSGGGTSRGRPRGAELRSRGAEGATGTTAGASSADHPPGVSRRDATARLGGAGRRRRRRNQPRCRPRARRPRRRARARVRPSRRWPSMWARGRSWGRPMTIRPRPVASFVPNPSDRGAGGSSSDESSKSSAMDAGGGASEPPPRRRPIGGAPRRAGRGPNRSSSIAQDQARARACAPIGVARALVVAFERSDFS